jgi:predicted nucleic acid-binding protein
MADVVLDASALILMAKIGLLEEISQELDLHTTEEVYREATRAETYDAQVIQQRTEDDKVIEEKAPEEGIEKILDRFNLDRGEASVIAYCREQNMDIVATDDKQAINACKILRIKFTTSLKLLERSQEKGLLSQEKALAKLGELDRYGWFKDSQVKSTEQNIRGENQE